MPPKYYRPGTDSAPPAYYDAGREEEEAEEQARKEESGNPFEEASSRGCVRDGAGRAA